MPPGPSKPRSNRWHPASSSKSPACRVRPSPASCGRPFLGRANAAGAALDRLTILRAPTWACIITRYDPAVHAYRMRVLNADGSRAGCTNGRGGTGASRRELLWMG